MRRVSFEDLAIGSIFTGNGCQFEKKSSRTAWLLSFDGKKYHRQKLWFYFSKKEQVYFKDL